jgi:hypothetical protein
VDATVAPHPLWLSPRTGSSQKFGLVTPGFFIIGLEFDFAVRDELALKSLHFNLWPAFQCFVWHPCELGKRKQEQPYTLRCWKKEKKRKKIYT